MEISLITVKNGIKTLQKSGKVATSFCKRSCAENVDKFVKSSNALKKAEGKKPYVKPSIKAFSTEPDSQLLAASDTPGNHGNHNGWEIGNGNANGRHDHENGNGYGYDDVLDGWDD